MIPQMGQIENRIQMDLLKIKQEMEASLRSAGSKIEQRSKLNAPVQSGKLQQSIESRQIEDEVAIYIDNASPAGAYAKFVHDKQPFIEEAFEEELPQIEQDILSRLDRIFT